MRGPKDFSDIALEVSATGAPIFLESLAFVDCRLQQVVAGGDHDMMIGTIVAGAVRDGEPLLFYAGQYASLASAAPASTAVAEGNSLDACFDHYGSF
jgi:3-hydroxy-9,10-secoandrosta-1,3,5(10)-triene-9,17-dione monooxygenase reductase component